MSPYDSFAQALLDSIGRKVGSVLEERGWQQLDPLWDNTSTARRRTQGTDTARDVVPAAVSACWV